MPEAFFFMKRRKEVLAGSARERAGSVFIE